MNPPQISSGQRSPLWPLLIAALLLASLAAIAWGITGFFRLSKEARCLRNSLKLATGPEAGWHERFELSVGPLTFLLLRTGLGLAPLQPEAQAAVATVRGAEAGIYRLTPLSGTLDYASIQAAADEAMAALGWQRLLGVAKDRDLVLVYVAEAPKRNLKACVAVLSGDQLVVASATSNVEALLNLATECAQRPELARWHVRL